jgi:hypothetical protein
MPTLDATRAAWRKSSRSGGQGNCVEVADTLTAIGVRDSKDPEGPVLVFARLDWQEFVEGVKRGAFDR